MSFNTMCAVCDLKHDYGPFKQRFLDLVDTVKRHDPDLISFQEIQSRKHVRQMSEALAGSYYAFFKNTALMGFTDATLFVRKSRFEVLAKGGVWLGPNLKKFNFGWTLGIPRRFQWVRLKDLRTGQIFVFVGSHFDNHFKNKDHSAAFAYEFFAKATDPIIFAADTNLQVHHNGYKALLGSHMRNSFDEVPEATFFTNAPSQPTDGCGNGSGGWPVCRIDHVLLSNDAPWTVASWGVDVFRYFKDTKFVSDHRAVVVDLVSAELR